MSIQDLLKTFGDKIDVVRRSSLGLPRSIDIDLSVAITDQLYHLAGNVFYALHAPDDTVFLDVKINSNQSHAIRVFRAIGFETPFDKLYITTPAGQTGTMTLIYGTEAPEMLRIIDNRSSTSLGMNQILAELQGDSTPEGYAEYTVGPAGRHVLAANANRKGCWICSDINNTEDVYLGFDDSLTTPAGGNKWFHVLTPGAAWGVDNYRGDIYAKAAGQGQFVGAGEW
jgi:hypothetical protein